MTDALSLLDPDRQTRRFRALRVSQPIGDIYLASVDYKSIGKLTRFDVRRRIQEERDIERYLGIQRPLNKRRVDQLSDYVNFIDATFPSTVIVALESDYASFDAEASEVVISNFREGESKPSIALSNVGRVIDGQHRIAGLDAYKSLDGKPFDVMTAFFLGSDIADQAYVFATVNLEQTKVNKSLAYDLFELARSRSPYKTCHNIAVAVDQSKGGPFYRRIKRLGVATEGRDSLETITQATFVNGLVGYVTDDPKRDRDDLLRGKNIPHADPKALKTYVFRNLFLTGQDVKIGKIYEEYFAAVAERWPEAWRFAGRGNILAKTNGYRALSSIFGRAYLEVAGPGEAVERGRFSRLFARVDVPWTYFDTENFKPGSSGESDLRNFLLEQMDLPR